MGLGDTLSDAIREIRDYQNGGCYKNLELEIEIVISAMVTLQRHLDGCPIEAQIMRNDDNCLIPGKIGEETIYIEGIIQEKTINKKRQELERLKKELE